ncbi:MAG: D-glycero-beta-D-manno-heptose 1-phosphate adenylyltransferase [Pseudomonadota bacterium]
MTKIIRTNDVETLCQELRSRGKKIVFTNGCFDLVHAGHIDYMEKAKKLGDVLFVGVNSDSSVKRIKGEKRPIVSESFRLRLLEGLSSIDHICIFNEDTPLELIKKVKPDILVKGEDWKDKGVVGEDLVRSYGGKVKLIELLPGISTSSIIEKILKTHK